MRHLRLPFQLLLSPIYLYGVLAGTTWTPTPEARPLLDPAVGLGWLALHVFLYGGTTAFNSYYDRDEGPVGGLRHPPRVDEGLLPFSLAVQAAGLVPALAVGPAFTAAWGCLFLVFAAYSHPAVRLKARPAAALAAIAFGQGALGFAAGWLAVAPAEGLVSRSAAQGALATALVVTGLYLVTQSYQVGEDARRGDRTLPVAWGPTRALQAATGVLAAGGLVLMRALHGNLGTPGTLGLAGFFVLLGGWLLRFAGRFDTAAVEDNFAAVMRFVTVASGGLSALLLALLIRPV